LFAVCSEVLTCSALSEGPACACDTVRNKQPVPPQIHADNASGSPAIENVFEIVSLSLIERHI